jgi:NAD(P)H dehydrogenase (quinone)
MCRKAKKVLTEKGHTVVVSDLYQQNFNPVADAADFLERKDPSYLTYALEQRYAAGAGKLAPDIQAEIDKVKACDLLILTFPIFWFSTPAILKGWIDRVFVSGIFYGGRRIYGKGGMAGKKALVAVTLGGREHMFGAQGIHGELEGLLRPVLQGTLGYVGMQVLQPFFGWHIPYISPEDRAATMQAWKDALSSIDDRPTIAMPDMSRFDETLKPLSSL